MRGPLIFSQVWGVRQGTEKVPSCSWLFLLCPSWLRAAGRQAVAGVFVSAVCGLSLLSWVVGG